MDFKIGQTVYHRNVYDHGEPLIIVGIRKNELELEGDYSGGINNVIQKSWMPIKGVSRVYNHKLKLDCRNRALEVIKKCKSRMYHTDGDSKTILDLANMVISLTEEVSLNNEF
jgi:hypothetical protein